MSPPHALESHIDFECFTALNGSTDLIDLVAPVFAQQAAQWIPDFASAITADDPDRVQHLLHQMAGCCGAICALPLAKGLRDAEQAVRSQGAEANRAELWRLHEKVQLLNDALVAHATAKPPSLEDP